MGFPRGAALLNCDSKEESWNAEKMEVNWCHKVCSPQNVFFLNWKRKLKNKLKMNLLILKAEKNSTVF